MAGALIPILPLSRTPPTVVKSAPSSGALRASNGYTGWSVQVPPAPRLASIDAISRPSGRTAPMILPIFDMINAVE